MRLLRILVAGWQQVGHGYLSSRHHLIQTKDDWLMLDLSELKVQRECRTELYVDENCCNDNVVNIGEHLLMARGEVDVYG